MSDSWTQWSLSYVPTWLQNTARNVRLVVFPSARKELYDGMYDTFYGNVYIWSVHPCVKDTPVGEYARELLGIQERETLPATIANFTVLTGMLTKMDGLLKDFFSNGGGVELLNDTVRTWYAMDAKAGFIVSSSPAEEAEVYQTLISRRAKQMNTLVKANENDMDPATEARMEHSVEYVIKKTEVVLDVIKQADEEGLLRHEVLFGQGGRGSHEQVKKEMARFTRERRARWEDSLGNVSDEERRLAFKIHLRDESERWGEELRAARERWDKEKH